MKNFLGLMGMLTCLGSLLFVSTAVGDLIQGSTETAPGVLVGLLIFFSGTAWAGGYLAKRKLFQGASTTQQAAHTHETAILQLAMQQKGRLNVAQVAATTSLSVAEAQEAIKRLSAQGVAELEFTDEGEVFHNFAGLGTGLRSESRTASDAQTVEAKIRPNSERNREL